MLVVIRHNFYLIFAVCYAVTLAAGSAVGFLVIRQTGINIGNTMSLIAFCIALFVSVTPTAVRFVYIDAPSPLSLRKIIKSKAKFIAGAYGGIAGVVDLMFYTAGSYYFTGGFKELNPYRIAGVMVVYAVIAYMILTSLYKSGSCDE